MKKKWSFKLLTILLAVFFISAAMPLTIFAEESDSFPSSSSISDSSGETSSEPMEGPDSNPEDEGDTDGSGSDLPSEEDSPSSEDPAGEQDQEQEEPSRPPDEPEIIVLDHISVIREDSRSRASAQMTLRRYDGIRWNFNKTSADINEHPWYLVDIGGMVAYCVEPNNPTSNNGIYTTFSYDSLSTDQRYAIGYAMLYGAKETRDPLYHMATQLVIWEIVYGYLDLTTLQPTGSILYQNTIGYNSYNQQAAVNYQQILNDMRNHKSVPSFMSSVEPGMPNHIVSGPNGAYEATFTNTNPNAHLSDFNFTDTSSVTFTKNGETLTVRSSSSLTDHAFAAYKGAAGFTDSLIYWGNGNNQVRATAGSLTPVPAYFRLTTKTVEATLVLIKLDEETGQPIAGVEFEISAGGTAIGKYTTDQDGKITVSGLSAGTYTIVETKPPTGYIPDTTPHTAVLEWGKTTTITISNSKLASLHLRKTCSESGAPLAGIEFTIYDSGGNLYGVYYTDSNGAIDLSAEFLPGRYCIRETKTLPGYVLDATERTVELKAGESVNITWVNQPERGRIIVTKIAAADNDLIGVSQGSLLPGAIFEIKDDNGNVVETLTTGPDGTATSKPLPLGRYTVIETSAPIYWLRNETVFVVDLVEHGLTVSLDVPNEPVRISTSIDKTGVPEARSGESIRYDFRDIGNTSNVPLSDFYWRDLLPAEVRIQSIVTGTWNEQLTYKVLYKTSGGNEYRVLAENLSTSQNYILDCSAAKLGLVSGEYVIEFRFEFGTVKAGFRKVETPYIQIRVNDGLPGGTQFVNRTDVGGRYEDKWVYEKDSWVTVVRVEEQPKLPKTGA